MDNGIGAVVEAEVGVHKRLQLGHGIQGKRDAGLAMVIWLRIRLVRSGTV